MAIDKKDNYILKEPFFAENNKPIYCLPNIIKNPEETVYIHEGESCVDAFTKLGFVATTSGSWSSAKTADWSILKGRKVIIWPDADNHGVQYAQDVTEILLKLNCEVLWIDINKLNLPIKGDCVDWISMQSPSSKEDCKIIHEKVSALPLMMPLVQNSENDTTLTSKLAFEIDENENADFSKTTLLLSLVEDVDFFHDEQKQAFATFKNTDHFETWPIESSKFKNWLAHQFWKTYKTSIHDSALRDAILVMTGKAIFEANSQKVFTRVGILDEKIYINLANAKWQAIEVSKDGWRILNNSPIKFRGMQNMQPLPMPDPYGDINLLWQHINVPPSTQRLVLAWVLDCLIPNTPFPLLILQGLQGSGKSHTQEILRKLVDPSLPNLRGAPKNADDILIAAANNWLVSYNNVSKISIENQDDFCCLSTGGGFSKRQLYTTEQESVIDIKRPVIMNGISELVTRPDLIDRCIIIELPEIKEKTRKSDNELDNEFNKDYPLIFGGLLNIFSHVLKILPNTQLLEKPRMASFALLGTALEHVLNLDEGVFMKEYKGNYQSSMASALENSPVAVALTKFMQNETQYSSTYGELLQKLSNTLYRAEMSGWPKSAKGLANILKRQAPALEIAGIKIHFEDKPKNDGYHLKIINLKKETTYS